MGPQVADSGAAAMRLITAALHNEPELACADVQSMTLAELAGATIATLAVVSSLFEVLRRSGMPVEEMWETFVLQFNQEDS